MERRHETDEAHQLSGSIEARQIAELRADRCGDHQRDAAMGRHRTDHGSQRPHRDQLAHLGLQPLHPSTRLYDRFDVLVQADLLARLHEFLIGQPLQVRLGPVGSTRVAPPVTQQE